MPLVCCNCHQANYSYNYQSESQKFEKKSTSTWPKNLRLRPPNLKQREPEQTASSVGSNNPKAELQLSTDDASTITTITSKLGGFDLSSDDVTSDEEPTTPPSFRSQ